MPRTLLTIAVLLAVAGCPKPAAGPELDPPEWAATEITQLRVIAGGDTVGDHIIQLHRVEHDGVPALNIITETMAGTADHITHDSAWVLVRLPNLRPVHSARRISNPEMDMTFELVYGREQVRVTALGPDGPEGLDLPFGPLDFDNEQVTTLIRALPLEPDEPFGFNIIIGAVGMKVPAELELIGNETVEVPVGTFECRRVRLTIAGQSVDIWYELDGLRRLVRYEAPVAELVMELVASVVN